MLCRRIIHVSIMFNHVQHNLTVFIPVAKSACKGLAKPLAAFASVLQMEEKDLSAPSWSPAEDKYALPHNANTNLGLFPWNLQI